MINIRRSVFETNSSSMHSMVIVKDPKPYTKSEMMFNVYNTDNGFKLFDWSEEGVYERSPYRVLRTPLQKLQYYVAYTLGTCKEYDKIPEIKALIKRQTGIKFDDIDLQHTETHYTRNGEERTTKDYGCVYENDTGEDVFHFVKRKGITMEDLIMSPKYIIITDGDEYQLFKALFESNILNAEDFEDISSGAAFWNDSDLGIYINWLDIKEKDGSFRFNIENLIEDLNRFHKTLTLRVDREGLKQYGRNLNRVKELVTKAKEMYPELITRIVFHDYSDYKFQPAQVADMDTSMFDKIILNEEEE